MKKLLCLTVCLMLLLCACTPAAPGGNPEGTPSSTGGTNESTQASTQAAAQNKKTLAESCIGKTVQELYALIGEPNNAEYVDSCLGDGEDGNLFYDGFIVYTYREGNTETVEYVE